MNKTLQFISLLIIAAKILTTIFKSGTHSEQYYLELSGITQSLNYGIFAGFLFAVNNGGKITQKTRVYLKYTFLFCVLISFIQLYTLLPSVYSSLIYWILVP